MQIKDGFEFDEPTPGVYVARAVGERAKEFPHTIQMSLSGAFLWNLLSAEDCDRAELILRLSGVFDTDVSTEQISADVDLFLSFLREQGLLVE